MNAEEFSKYLELGDKVYILDEKHQIYTSSGIVRMIDLNTRKIGVEITSEGNVSLFNIKPFRIYYFSRVVKITGDKSLDNKINKAIKEAADSIKYLGDSMVIGVREIQKITNRLTALENKVEKMDEDLVDAFEIININFETIDENFDDVEKELNVFNEIVEDIDEDLNSIYDDFYIEPICSASTFTFISDNFVSDCECDCDEDECCDDCFEKDCDSECRDCEFNDVCKCDEDDIDMSELEEIAKAFDENAKVQTIQKFLEILKTDKDYYQAWQANIAMSYIDTWNWYKKANDCKSKDMDKSDRHNIANDAAENFLDLLLERNETLKKL